MWNVKNQHWDFRWRCNARSKLNHFLQSNMHKNWLFHVCYFKQILVFQPKIKTKQSQGAGLKLAPSDYFITN